MQIRTYAAGIGSVVMALAIAGTRLDATPAQPRTDSMTLEAEAAVLHPDRVEIVQQSTFPSNRGVSLRPGVTTNVGAPETQPDLVFNVRAPRAGRNYQVLLAGLAPGNWTVRGQDGKLRFNARVEADKNTALAVAPGGSYTVRPETIPATFHSPAPSLRKD